MDVSAITFRTPQNKTEWQEYYELRWRVLRKPWNQPRESEKDDLENQSRHIAAYDSNGNIYAVGRLHQVSSTKAQIRYMAVEPDLQRNGIGRLLLQSLENLARNECVSQITLNARDDYLGFYLKNGYQILTKAHTLFGRIPHTTLTKAV